jgi:hypothetical protein
VGVVVELRCVAQVALADGPAFGTGTDQGRRGGFARTWWLGGSADVFNLTRRSPRR